MEFYRVATFQISEGVCVSADVEHMFGTRGLVDFYVNDSRKWAVEILRDDQQKHVGKVDSWGFV
jgi:hypothetical protein